MPRWIRRILGVLALGGGAVGFIVVLTTMLHTTSVVAVLFMLLFCAMYIFGIVCGTAMIEGHAGAVSANAAFWAMQIPMFNSHALGYFFSSGFHLTVYYRWDQARLGVDFLVGSTFRFNVLHATESPMVGVNLFALVAFIYLLRYMADQKVVPVLARPLGSAA